MFEPLRSQITSDLREASHIARRYLVVHRRVPGLRRAVRRANFLLAAEWAALIAVSYWIWYGPWDIRLRAVIFLPWSLYSALALDNIAHYLNHWPLFKSNALNALWRCSGVSIQFNVLEIKYAHLRHHFFNNSIEDGSTTLIGVGVHARTLRYVAYGWLSSMSSILPWNLDHHRYGQNKAIRRVHLMEIRAIRWLSTAWMLLLVTLDWRNTLLFVTPATLFIYPISSMLMNYTDHVPGNPDNPFQQATYFDPFTRWQSFICMINHNTAATHLTHHLFPQVHWILLPRLQRKLKRYFERHNAPRSLMINSVLLGNPLSFMSMLFAFPDSRYIYDT